MTTSAPIIILITGANTGLGYEAARALASKRHGSFHVLIGARSAEKAENAVKKILETESSAEASLVEPLLIDIDSDESIEAAAKQVEAKHGKLDILVNNAAIGNATKDVTTKRAQYNAVLNTNFTGTAIVTDAFLPLLQKSTAPSPGRRLVNVSSVLGSNTLASTGEYVAQPYTVYSASKAAMNLLTLYTKERVKDDKITVLAMSPGYCATNLNGFTGHLSAEQGGLNIVRSIVTGNFETANGKFFGDNEGQYYPW